MFFVIAGDRITASARSAIRHDEAWWHFLYRRARRIDPTYWLSLIISAGTPFWLEWVSSLKSHQYVPPSAASLNNGFLHYSLLDWVSVASMARVLLDVPGATDQHKFTTINSVYWSLAIEVQFDIVVAVALAFRRSFYGAMIAVTLASLPFAFMPATAVSGFFMHYWLMFGARHCPVLAAGARIDSRGGSTRRAPRWSQSACCPSPRRSSRSVSTVCARTIRHGDRIRSFSISSKQSTAPCLSRAAGSRFVTVRWATRGAMALGAMSYSLYLVHNKLRAVTAQPLQHVLPPNSILVDVATILLTCVVSYGFYLLCERPFLSAGAKARVAAEIHAKPAAPTNPASSVVAA